jgi:hypothetical protein
MSAIYSEDTTILLDLDSDYPLTIEEGITLQISTASLVGAGTDVTVSVADVTFADYVASLISIYSP